MHDDRTLATKIAPEAGSPPLLVPVLWSLPDATAEVKSTESTPGEWPQDTWSRSCWEGGIQNVRHIQPRSDQHRPVIRRLCPKNNAPSIRCVVVRS